MRVSVTEQLVVALKANTAMLERVSETVEMLSKSINLITAGLVNHENRITKLEELQ